MSIINLYIIHWYLIYELMNKLKENTKMNDLIFSMNVFIEVVVVLIWIFVGIALISNLGVHKNIPFGVRPIRDLPKKRVLKKKKVFKKVSK